MIDVMTGESEVVFSSSELIEAPNWTPDGSFLIFNAGGEIFRIAVDGKGLPVRIDTGDLDDLNNDHILSPDGAELYVSSDDGHLYAVPVTGGMPRRVSNHHSSPFHYYLHGISPDGTTLAYVAVEGEGNDRRINLFTIPSVGGADLRLSDIDRPNDGPEFTPDGRWIYFNSEREALQPGHSQIFRMRPDGSAIEQLTFDKRVNWFPHLSPDGAHMVYLSYPSGTLGHPADKDVILRLMAADGGEPHDLAAFFGGQGTINVNSWAPDSRRLAYVAYPLYDSSLSRDYLGRCAC
ncbi:TolB family protein [Rhizobium alvei]|uniref:Biopolymer transporter Tol n=1 Tax=Rhizobium alvei TaxID=1132659 RepID=A0ABT8YMF2_9HYPH|nr:biopolymer transporter Tol [Rhizobium alvei]MDO6964405.1 biopolymer transporter Tol [Rhizobium alvei]